jgi:hypothetical protein
MAYRSDNFEDKSFLPLPNSIRQHTNIHSPQRNPMRIGTKV